MQITKQYNNLFHTIFLMTVFLMTLSGCGDRYLSQQERAKLHLAVERAKEAQAQFAEPSLQSAQMVLKTIQDANPIIKASVEKAPAEFNTELTQMKREWEKQVLQTSALAKSDNLSPFYQLLGLSIQSTIGLMEKIETIDDQL